VHLGPRGTGVLAACLLLLSVLLIFVSADGELLLLRAGTAYGNYDAAPVPGALRLLSPGVSDYAAKKTYLFGEGLHLAPLAGVGAIFLVLLLLVLSPGRKTSRTRGLVQ